jgi:hypothetical protein
MMLRERGLVAGVVALGLLAASGISPGQSPAHKPKPKIVQPDSGAPPEQAVQPDQAAPLDQTMPVDPGIPPEENPPDDPVVEEKPPVTPPPVPERAAEPAQEPASEPAQAEPMPQPQVVEAKAVEKPKPEEKPFVASTPRQALLEKEAVRLLQLTQELKAEVDKAGANMLSLAALRKADEVQKLSKDLKEKMKDQGQVVAGKP